MMEGNGPNAAKDRWNEKQTPSILEAKIKGTMDHQMIDGVRNKSLSKIYNKKIWFAWKILGDLYRSLLAGKLHSQKKRNLSSF